MFAMIVLVLMILTPIFCYFLLRKKLGPLDTDDVFCFVVLSCAGFVFGPIAVWLWYKVCNYGTGSIGIFQFAGWVVSSLMILVLFVWTVVFSIQTYILTPRYR
jgi:hypothetical protein